MKHSTQKCSTGCQMGDALSAVLDIDNHTHTSKHSHWISKYKNVNNMQILTKGTMYDDRRGNYTETVERRYFATLSTIFSIESSTNNWKVQLWISGRVTILYSFVQNAENSMRCSMAGGRVVEVFTEVESELGNLQTQSSSPLPS